MAESVINYLKNDLDKIYYLLKEAGFLNITISNKIKFAFDDKGGAGSCQIDPETLQFTRWSTGTHGRIFDAIMLKKNIDFSSAVNWCKYKLGISSKKIEEVESNITKPLFNGLFEKKEYVDKIYNMEELLKNFEPCVSQRFLDDNISIKTQLKYNIMYDKLSSRVVILWKNKNGSIVGYNSRANFEIDESYKMKYLSSEGFNKRNHLFGLYENKEHIKNNFCIVVEAEKSVMQSDTFGFYNIVALGSSGFSKNQLNLLTELNVSDIIILLDEGSSYNEKYLPMIKNLTSFGEKVPRIWYLDDYTGFKKKASPTDMGVEFFKEVVNNRIKLYGCE